MRLKWRDKELWYRWFAWHPVVMSNSIIWLQYVERRWNPGFNLVAIHPDDRGEYAGAWEYRND